MARFRSLVDRSAGPDGCWRWTGTHRHLPWGSTGRETISRLAWLDAHGELPPAYPGVRRTCKNKLCLNPQHLVATREQRFWAYVNKDGPVMRAELGPCWVWTGTITTNGGYGELRVGAGRPPVRANRFSYELNVGPIAGGLQVLHHCDNPPCVHPKHLYLGTDLENNRDKIARNRTAKGAVLSAAIARARATSPFYGARTHCRNGHELTPENTHTNARGSRTCRTCSRTNARRERDRRSAHG